MFLVIEERAVLSSQSKVNCIDRLFSDGRVCKLPVKASDFTKMNFQTRSNLSIVTIKTLAILPVTVYVKRVRSAQYYANNLPQIVYASPAGSYHYFFLSVYLFLNSIRAKSSEQALMGAHPRSIISTLFHYSSRLIKLIYPLNPREVARTSPSILPLLSAQREPS